MLQLKTGEWPNGIAIDFVTQRLYFVEPNGDTIQSFSAVDGSDLKTLLPPRSGAEGVVHGFGLDLLDDFIYWTDWQRSTVEKAQKVTGEKRKILANIRQIMGLVTVNLNSTPPVEPKNLCGHENGGCSHLCFYRPFEPICACPRGMELAPKDNRTCVKPAAYLLYTQNSASDVFRFTLDLGSFSVGPNSLRLHDIRRPMVLDVDLDQQYIYWSEARVSEFLRF